MQDIDLIIVVLLNTFYRSEDKDVSITYVKTIKNN